MKLRIWLSLSTIIFMSLGVFPSFAQAVEPSNGSDSLSYSTDGSNYSLKPPVLFADTAVLVPGDKLKQSFWVKNDRLQPISIRVEPRGSVTDSAVKIIPVNTKETKLNAGEATEVVVQLWLPREAPNQSQDLVEQKLGVVVNAKELFGSGEDEPPRSPESPPVEPPEGHKPDGLGDTGFNSNIVPLGIGIALAGCLLYLSSKRRAQRTNNTEGELP
ncbi:hypothetical protein [Arthrobacter sp. MYb213]|uniref:hypothetical protein n=1 Tax=Arthrobacter sp. MYb213 TaxID=1848595 RepID=UPI000CFE33EB|nr:hypothetical protein [Arthrobacter sp. MYb213]PRB70469.1 hypothetical protein CQ011_10025 [Arthrobacter sp. MYb213]